MEKVIEKRCAKKCNGKGEDDKTWFMTDKKTMFYQVKTPEIRDHSEDPY